MDPQAIENFISEKKEITVPLLQKEMGIGYAEARKAVGELVAKGRLVHKGGLAYEYIPSEPKEKSVKKREAEARNYRENLERCTLENLLRQRRAEGEDGEKSGETRKEPPISPLARRFRDFAKGQEMQDILIPLQNGISSFKQGTEAVLRFDVCYPNDIQYQFKLFSLENDWFLSDQGLTMQFLRAESGVEEEKLLKKTEEILSDYDIHLSDGEIRVEIKDRQTPFPAFLFLFSAVERITRLKADDF